MAVNICVAAGAVVCGAVSAVSGTICSSHLTSFLCVCVHSLALTLAPSLSVLLNHQITGCSHSLTLFILRCQ